MTRPLKRPFTLLFTTLVGSLLLLSPSTAFAADHGLKVTSRLYVQGSSGSPIDVTNDYYDQFVRRFNPSAKSDSQVGLAAFQRDYKKAQDHGTILLLQHIYSSTSASVYMHFNYSRDCGTKLSRGSDGSYTLGVTSSNSDCHFRAISLDSWLIARYDGNASSKLAWSHYVSSPLVSVYMYTGDYVVADSAHGAPKLPNGAPLSAVDSLDWNRDCGLDVGCHLGNIGNAVKGLFEFIGGFFDFSNNNSFLKIFKFLIISNNAAELFDFSDLATAFKSSFKVVFEAVDLLRSFFSALYAPITYWGTSAYCSTSPVGDAGNHDSSGHNYIFQARFFGHEFKPDVCSFERALGGHGAMATVRVFAGFALAVTSLFIWYFFLNRILGERL